MNSINIAVLIILLAGVSILIKKFVKRLRFYNTTFAVPRYKKKFRSGWFRHLCGVAELWRACTIEIETFAPRLHWAIATEGAVIPGSLCYASIKIWCGQASSTDEFIQWNRKCNICQRQNVYTACENALKCIDMPDEIKWNIIWF